MPDECGYSVQKVLSDIIAVTNGDSATEKRIQKHQQEIIPYSQDSCRMN